MTAAVTFILLSLAQAPDPEALSAKALEMAQQRRLEEAEKLWKQALEIAPNLFSAAFNLGFLYHSQQQYAKAEPWLARAAKVQPKDFNARYLLGVTFSQLGRTDDALRQWRAALALRPDQVKLMQIMAVEYGKGRYYREAAAVAERALGLSGDDPGAYLIAVNAYQDAADHASALRIAKRMVEKFPAHPRANFEFAYELHHAGRRDESLPYLKKAMGADSGYEEPFYLYGDILLQQERYGEAMEPLRKAIALKGEYTAARMSLARALMSLERYREAERELAAAVEADPLHPQPHLLLSQLHFRMGNEELAAREKQLSLKLRREHPHAMEPPQGRPFR